ncbi:putative O-glycosylation ligase, exosortase A system-associated [Rheinheimera pleomorphica]|uniref:putative O-glycosylation ligase, exosortase A system-associated n=1 Tax=Rheinheimera pleomorphica TaxID=2703963 RepID=UPI00141FA74F|nr:putative O-glycosylation ligase, exosortase A system-associated [Rheinheimera pleomorphica]
MRDLLLVGFLFVAIFYAFKRPYLGVAAWVWIALTAPANWAFGFSQDFRLNLTIVLVTALAYVFVQKQKSFKLGGIGMLVILFCFWTFITTLFNNNSSPSYVWYIFTEFLKVAALFFFLVLIVRKRLHIDTIIWALILSVSSYAGMEAVKFILSGGGHKVVGRAGIMIDRNDLAVAINMCIPFIVYLIQSSKHRLVRHGLWLLLGLNVIAIIGTGSRGGFIGLAILALAFWWRSRHKLIWLLLAALVLPVAYQYTPEQWRERQSTIQTAATEDGSFIGRLWAWKISSMIARDDPLTGGGFRAVTDPILWHSYAPYTPVFGPIDTPEIPADKAPKAAHNVYFQVLGDHGVVGFIIFMLLLLSTFLASNQSLKLMRKHKNDWGIQLCSALYLSLIGYAVTGANVSLAYFDLAYTLYGLIAVVSLRRQELLTEHSGHDAVKVTGLQPAKTQGTA